MAGLHSYLPEMTKIRATLALASLLCWAVAAPTAAQAQGAAEFTEAVEQAERLEQLETLIIAQDGEVLVEEGFRGHSTDEPTNIKSASKSIISALVGIAIEKGVLEGTEQTIAPLLEDKLPDDPDPRIHDITIGDLLSMQAGLGRTSGPNYGAWIANDDWVRAALARPFQRDPGEGMLYSTGSTHLLSAILTRETGKSTLELAHEWLAPLEDFHIADWERGPQGIYLGGNQMAMTPESLLAFGELYRNGGRAGGEPVLPEAWIAESWRPRTRSVFSGESYGYGWFVGEIGGYDVPYAWGYGGQMLYIVPELELTVVMTSAADQPSARSGYRDALHDLMGRIVAAVEGADSGS